MNVGHSNEDELTMSPAEAQSVIELWAQRQRQDESKKAMPSVTDLSEVLSLPPEEVVKLLAQVRATPPTMTTARPAVDRRVLIPIIMISVVLWLATISAFVWWSSISSSAPAARFEEPVMGNGPPAIAGAESLGADLPAGLTLEFRGYTVIGSSSRTIPADELEGALLPILETVLNQMTPLQGSGANVTPSDLESITTALGKNSNSGVESYLEFHAFRTSVGGQDQVLMLPVALTSNDTIVKMVQAEQMRRLRVLANGAANLFRGRG